MIFLKKTIGLFAFLLLVCSVKAQKIEIQEVIASAFQDAQLKPLRQIGEMSSDLNFRSPWVKEVSARVGFNGSALGDTIYGYLRNEDTYQLRIGFNALRERNLQREIQGAYFRSFEAQGREMEQELVFARYEALTSFIFSEKNWIACQQLDSLLSKKQEISRKMLAQGLDLSVSKILDLEEDQVENRLRLQELADEVSIAKAKLTTFVGEFSELNTEKLISVSQIKQKIADFNNEQTLSGSLYSETRAKIQLRTTELALVNAQNRQIFDFFNVGYQRPLYLERPNKFNTLNNFSMRVGLTLPIPANHNFKKAEATIKLQEARNELFAKAVEQTELAKIQTVRLEKLIKRYELMEGQGKNSLISTMLANQNLLAQLNPMEIVELHIAAQKLVTTKAEIEAELMEEYVKYLYVSGMLYSQASQSFLEFTRE